MTGGLSRPLGVFLFFLLVLVSFSPPLYVDGGLASSRRGPVLRIGAETLVPRHRRCRGCALGSV